MPTQVTLTHLNKRRHYIKKALFQVTFINQIYYNSILISISFEMYVLVHLQGRFKCDTLS